MLSSLVIQGQPVPSEPRELPIPWWSFTKTVLAATALSLVRDQIVELDQTLVDQPFTLRQLLRHEAGLADYGELAEYHAAVANNEPAWSCAEMLRRLDGLRLRYAPGSNWHYSNVGYMLVGRLIEQLTGLSLEQAVTQRVLIPLGLVGVRFAKTPTDLADSATGSACNYDPAWVYHGLLIGPVSQAALFLDRLLGTDFLPDELLEQVQSARALGGPIAGRPWATAGYGLGVMQGSVDGGPALCGHTGSGPGSVIAVYRAVEGDSSACCAVFDRDATQGAIESVVVATLSAALPMFVH